MHTVDMERFVGVNIHSFNPIKVFVEILLHCFGQKSLLFSTIKERHLYSWKNFRGTLKNHENCESLAQQIFTCLWLGTHIYIHTYVHTCI